MGHRTGKARTIFRDHTTAIPRHSLLCLLAADLISAWPAPIRQSTPTPPQSGAGHSSPPTQSSPPAQFWPPAQSSPPATSRAVRPKPGQRFCSRAAALHVKTPCLAIPVRQIAWSGSTIRPEARRVERRRASGCCFFACRYRKTAAHPRVRPEASLCATCIKFKKTVASRGQKVLKTVSMALNVSRSGCTRQGLMICCRFKENE
ncbi:hypothetical protein SAMN05428953_13141 [Mesorhizobium muleiense]|uniref:Uncharacterized protein n=1 Tax=Mesorhizobium muleiense TaxID=1004279 RepID=A0A1G9IQY4_9HYPH|nr:hypothetical protein SAMN05428953_13141 [Mesorhizobium muleiense]